jgi:hypothetical protein
VYRLVREVGMSVSISAATKYRIDFRLPACLA